MVLKEHLGNMDKAHRAAFLELERMIIKSKRECLSAIPQERVYDDTEIKKTMQIVQSKMERIERMYKENRKIMVSYGVWQRNNKAFLDKLVSMDDGFGIFSDLMVVIYNALKETPYIIEMEKTPKWKDRLKDIDDWAKERNKLHEKINSTVEEYQKKPVS